MKNGFLLFLVLLPIFLLETFGLLPTIISTPLTVTACLFFLRQTLINYLNSPSAISSFKGIFSFILKTGLFYSFWFGLYYYIMINYVQTDIMEKSMELVKQGEFFQNKSGDEAYWNDVAKAMKSPVTWIFYAFTINSFLFSLLGLIFGLIFKSRAEQ